MKALIILSLVLFVGCKGGADTAKESAKKMTTENDPSDVVIDNNQSSPPAATRLFHTTDPVFYQAVDDYNYFKNKYLGTTIGYNDIPININDPLITGVAEIANGVDHAECKIYENGDKEILVNKSLIVLISQLQALNSPTQERIFVALERALGVCDLGRTFNTNVYYRPGIITAYTTSVMTTSPTNYQRLYNVPIRDHINTYEDGFYDEAWMIGQLSWTEWHILLKYQEELFLNNGPVSEF